MSTCLSLTLAFIQQTEDLLSSDGGKLFKKIIEVVTSLQVFEKRLYGHSSASKARCSVHNVRILGNDWLIHEEIVT